MNMQLVTTSFLDKNYYVVNGFGKELMYLRAILKDSFGTKYEGQLSQLFSLDQHFFVEKNSDLGRILTKLIHDKKIADEQMMIRKDKLINALIQLNLEDNYYGEVLEVISNLVKKEYDKVSVADISKEYDINILKQIIELGMKSQNYLEQTNPNLTGYEEECYFYDTTEEKWKLLNIVTKEVKPIKDEENKVRRRSRF